MILHIIELVVGDLQMSPARRFEGLSLMQYTVTRSKHHFLPVSGKKKVRYLCDTSLRKNHNRLIALSNLDCIRPIHHQGSEHLAVHPPIVILMKSPGHRDDSIVSRELSFCGIGDVTRRRHTVDFDLSLLYPGTADGNAHGIAHPASGP